MSPRPAGDDEVAAVLDCLRSGWLTMGPRTQAFEAAFAEWAGAAHAIAVGTGAAALHLALLALGVRGEQVTVPALAPAVAAEAVRWAGGEPAFRDAGEETAVRLTLDGFSVDGITCHDFGDAAPLPIGEGGMVTTDSSEHATRIRTLRGHALTSGTWDRHRGHATGYDVVDIGFNYRLDEMRAALGAVRLAGLGAELERRAARETYGPAVIFASAAERDAARVPGATTLPLLADLPRARDLHGRHLVLPGP